ncbi:hypothetical protein AB1Y20_007278 [Prymnesium parvum]|uniref:Exostosin GT47 domain-containing protein n=1 Tax=Prymnesium parvum TaxID=97485 RepID=A0AB34IU32_PRYPA
MLLLGATAAAGRAAACFDEHPDQNLPELLDGVDRCAHRYATLARAQRACTTEALCAGVTQDLGVACAAEVLRYELRAGSLEPYIGATSWVAKAECAPLGTAVKKEAGGEAKQASGESKELWGERRGEENPRSCGESVGGGGEGARSAGGGGVVEVERWWSDGVEWWCRVALDWWSDGVEWWCRVGLLRNALPAVREAHDAADRLDALFAARLALAQQRMARGPPAFERFPHLAFRYRDWGSQTRHARGDAYPLYTLDTLRNLADHLFDASTGYRGGAERAALVRPCDFIYSTLRPTAAFVHQVHEHIGVPYLLMTDTADEPITHGGQTELLLRSPKLRHWWAVDNEVLDNAKVDSIPLGVMDAFEIGIRGDPSSVSFHANSSDYIATLRASHAQPKERWLMMQMSDTHPERRLVRAAFKSKWGDGEVRITQERSGRMSVRKYLMLLGQHKFVLSPRGNGLDAHRTWEALLVGAIPIVRSSQLNPLYARLPVLVVKRWEDVTPTLLRNFYAQVQSRLPLYHYERLFADYWIGEVAVHRERCLAEVRAARAPQFIYKYNSPGGWVELKDGKPQPAPVLDVDAKRGGRG